ncbi:hypothetical protein LNKW23_10200 [Paralimibaculum aggregatum]|uniref:Uncharacterized protein n=1 Tax=Paralimibaculum aggregatum TaxID=3036245 RepID=A0ABQ6LFP8_9RHOB|nr:DUF6173 family protein [Limibaculum sp. NKW23]GMG81807.1 hypothetical protein LNKW23_10200 [Limibaculum sp. NKW23]
MTDRPTLKPEARAVRTDCNEGDCAENQPLPEAIARGQANQKSPAEWAYLRLALYLRKFEEQLDSEHEVGIGVAGSEAGALHIRGVGYFAPDLVTFYGLDQHGAKTQLIQHVSQLNVMLKAVPKQAETAERIGFQLASRIEADGEAEAAAAGGEGGAGGGEAGAAAG